MAAGSQQSFTPGDLFQEAQSPVYLCSFNSLSSMVYPPSTVWQWPYCSYPPPAYYCRPPAVLGSAWMEPPLGQTPASGVMKTVAKPAATRKREPSSTSSASRSRSRSLASSTCVSSAALRRRRRRASPARPLPSPAADEIEKPFVPCHLRPRWKPHEGSKPEPAHFIDRRLSRTEIRRSREHGRPHWRHSPRNTNAGTKPQYYSLEASLLWGARRAPSILQGARAVGHDRCREQAMPA